MEEMDILLRFTRSWCIWVAHCKRYVFK